MTKESDLLRFRAHRRDRGSETHSIERLREKKKKGDTFFFPLLLLFFLPPLASKLDGQIKSCTCFLFFSFSNHDVKAKQTSV